VHERAAFVSRQYLVNIITITNCAKIRPAISWIALTRGKRRREKKKETRRRRRRRIERRKEGKRGTRDNTKRPRTWRYALRCNAWSYNDSKRASQDAIQRERMREREREREKEVPIRDYISRAVVFPSWCTQIIVLVRVRARARARPYSSPGVPPHFAFTIALSLTHGLQLICNEMRQRSRK